MLARFDVSTLAPVFAILAVYPHPLVVRHVALHSSTVFLVRDSNLVPGSSAPRLASELVPRGF